MNTLTFRQKFAALFSIALMTGFAVYLCIDRILIVAAIIFRGLSYFFSYFTYLIPVVAAVPFVLFGFFSIIKLAKALLDESKTAEAKKTAKITLIIGISYFALLIILINVFRFNFFSAQKFYIVGLILSIATLVFLLIPIKALQPTEQNEIQKPKRNYNLFPLIIIAMTSGVWLYLGFGGFFSSAIEHISLVLDGTLPPDFISWGIFVLFIALASVCCCGTIITLIVFYMLPHSERIERMIKLFIFITLIIIIVICGLWILHYMLSVVMDSLSLTSSSSIIILLEGMIYYFPLLYVAATVLSIIALRRIGQQKTGIAPQN